MNKGKWLGEYSHPIIWDIVGFMLISSLKTNKFQAFFSLCQLRQIGKLGGGFKHFLFSPLFGEDSHFD